MPKKVQRKRNSMSVDGGSSSSSNSSNSSSSSKKKKKKSPKKSPQKLPEQLPTQQLPTQPPIVTTIINVPKPKSFKERFDTITEEIGRKINPSFMKVWDKLVTDKKTGVIAASHKTSKSAINYIYERQQIADSLFKAAINFQSRVREDGTPRSTDQLSDESGSMYDPTNPKDFPGAGSRFNKKLLNLLDGIFEENEIEENLITLLKHHRGRMEYRQKMTDYYAAKLSQIRASRDGGSSSSSSTSTTTTSTSKRKRGGRNDNNSSSEEPPKKKRVRLRMPKMKPSNQIGVFTPKTLKKAFQIRDEMISEVIVKWGLFDYNHMMAARQIEAKYFKREIEPGLIFGKFFGRFFSSKMADELIPRIKNEKKDDPEYSILPIIARDLKHVKGHLSFMQVRRDIRGKRGGDNWQIHEYTNPPQGKLNNTNHDLNFDDAGSSSITNSRNSRGNRSYNNIRDV